MSFPVTRSIPLLERLLYRQQILRQGNRFHLGRKKHINASSYPWVKTSVGITIGGLILYDGYMNNFTFLGASGRFLRSLKVATLITTDYLLLLAQENDPDSFNNKLKKIHLKSADRILDACLVNGGLYIKVGQGVAAINHVLPEEYTSTLSKLQDECLSSSKEEVIKLFREDFGKTPEEIFKEFDYKPVAAASLAQVFKAKLHSGEEVAVKVQYNDLQKRFPSDLGTIIFLQDIIEYFFKSYNFGWIFHYVRNNLEKELDFLAEGKNAEQCAKDLQHLKYVYIPKVFWEFSKTRVLTLEWINGYKVSDMGSIKAKNINLTDLDKKLFNIFSEQIFKTGFIHADPHPGNIFFRKIPNGELQIILLDHGLYEGLSKEVRKQLCQFWEAAVLRDETAMKQIAKNLNITGYKMFAEILFQSPYEIEGARLKTKLTDEDLQYMQNVAKTSFEKIMNTLKQMPTNMFLVVRNLNTIRAIGKDHGDPVDRVKLMARFAQKCVYQDTNRIFGFFKWLARRIRFEYCLLKTSLKLSLLTYYLDTLHKLGRSPEGSSMFFELRR